MSNLPFGFGLPDPHDKEGKSGNGDPQGADAFNQLGQMLSQLGQMFSQASTSSGPVNYELAKQIALQKLAENPDKSAPSIGFSSSEGPGDSSTAVRDATHLAELWLDPATILPAGATTAVSWSAKKWVEETLPTWQRLCDPVAKRVSGAWIEALPAEAKEAAGPMLAMMGQMGGMAFGSQLGTALAQLGSEVLTSTEVGLPLGPAGVSALLPVNIEKFSEGLELRHSEVLVFLAAREAAHQRLFTHVPWLRQRLLALVEEFASGITVDVSALEQLAGQVDPSNPESIETAMSSGLFEPQTTPEQQAALNRLETLLALVEGWVDVVVTDAIGERLPGAGALRETLRRRRATGGPAEQTFATLVGLELRPRRMRAATALWKLVGDQHGMNKRDDLWSHPDLMPTTKDLDEPLDFAAQLGAGNTENADFDPMAELERTQQAEDKAAEDKLSENKASEDESSVNPSTEVPSAGDKVDKESATNDSDEQENPNSDKR